MVSDTTSRRRSNGVDQVGQGPFGKEVRELQAFVRASSLCLCLLLAAIRNTQTFEYGALMKNLPHTRGYKGATGTITINPSTGNRTKVPVYILTVSAAGQFITTR